MKERVVDDQLEGVPVLVQIENVAHHVLDVPAGQLRELDGARDGRLRDVDAHGLEALVREKERRGPASAAQLERTPAFSLEVPSENFGEIRAKREVLELTQRALVRPAARAVAHAVLPGALVLVVILQDQFSPG